MKEEVILTILPHQLREVLKRENIDFQSIQEIRLSGRKTFDFAVQRK